MLAARFLLVAVSTTMLPAQDAKTAILGLYSSTLQALRTVESREGLVRMVDSIDVPEWTSSLPNGHTMTRAQAVRELEAILPVAPEKRPEFHIEPIYWNETAAAVAVVYWVYTGTGGNLTGSIARDTWARTAVGWRRTRHEKFLPDRPLVKDGRPVLVPSR